MKRRAFRFAFDGERSVGDWNRDGAFTQLDGRGFFLQWSGCREQRRWAWPTLARPAVSEQQAAWERD